MSGIDVLTKAPTRPVMFMAKRLALRLVHTGIDDIRGANGKLVGETEGLTLEFKDARLIWDPSEPKVAPGKAGSDPEVLEWLRAHPRNGDGADGFMEIAEVAPDAAPLLAELVMAVADRNVEKVATIYTDEDRGYRREPVLLAAGAALEKWAREDAEAEEPEPERDEPTENEKELDPTSSVLGQAHPDLGAFYRGLGGGREEK